MFISSIQPLPNQELFQNPASNKQWITIFKIKGRIVRGRIVRGRNVRTPDFPPGSALVDIIIIRLVILIVIVSYSLLKQAGFRKDINTTIIRIRGIQGKLRNAFKHLYVLSVYSVIYMYVLVCSTAAYVRSCLLHVTPFSRPIYSSNFLLCLQTIFVGQVLKINSATEGQKRLILEVDPGGLSLNIPIDCPAKFDIPNLKSSIPFHSVYRFLSDISIR